MDFKIEEEIYKPQVKISHNYTYIDKIIEKYINFRIGCSNSCD